MENREPAETPLEARINLLREEEEQRRLIQAEATRLAQARSEVLRNPNGHSAKELFGENGEKLCSEFLEIMKQKNFPGIEVIKSKSVEVPNPEYPKSFLGKLFVDTTIPKTISKSSVLQRGYTIGRAIEGYEGSISFEEWESGWSAKDVWEDAFYKFAKQRKSKFYLGFQDPSLLRVMLCEDGRIRSDKIGSFSDNLNIITGGNVTSNPNFHHRDGDDSHVSYSKTFAALSLEDTLAAIAFKYESNSYYQTSTRTSFI